jgi:N-acetylglucosaminyldiphosphoundecaprenol N-acetyl-beta-D-mannosaminyltransferase
MISDHPLGHVKISSGDLEEILEFIAERISENRKTYCIPLNLTKYVVSKDDHKLKNVMNAADLLISDGISMVWLSKRAGYKDVHRVTGIDLAEKILSHSKARGWKIFLLGATPENLNTAIKNLKDKFGEPLIAGSHDGYFRRDEDRQMIDLINQSGSDILFLGLAMPQKEYFVHDYFKKINVKFCLAVGGAFDVWAGVKKRTPKAVQNIGLEWLFRSFYDINKIINVTRYGLIFLKELLVYKK